MKRILAIMLAMILVVSTTVTVMADDAAELSTEAVAKTNADSGKNDAAKSDAKSGAKAEKESAPKASNDSNVIPSDASSTTKSQPESVSKDSNDSNVNSGDASSSAESQSEAANKDEVKLLDEEASKDKYVVSYLNTDGVTEFTAKYSAGEEVDLSKRLGGGEAQTGWAKEKDGAAISQLTMPESDVKLYPVIDKNKTTYKVNFLKEKASGSGYDLADSITIDANIGDTVSADTVQSSGYSKNYEGFKYDSSASSSNQQVAADGTTTVDVKFNRNEYTLKFDINGNYKTVGKLYYATLKMNIGGTEYQGKSYSFTAKYGEDISNKFPTKDNVVDNPYLAVQHSDYFVGWTDASGNIHVDGSTLDGRLLNAADSNGTIDLSGRWADSSSSSSDAPTVTIKYNIYQQKVDKSGYDFVETIDKSAKASSLSTVSLDGYKGFSHASTTPVGEKLTVKYGPWYSQTTVSYYGENNVYFDRNSYDVIYKINSETINTESLTYGAELSNLSDYQPANKPAGRSYLDGWYDKDGVIATADSKMPAEDLVLRGSWKYGALETKTLAYDANEGTGSVEDSTVAKGATVRVNDGSSLTRDGYNFKGWNTAADGSGTSYAPSDLMDLDEDVTLFAVWEEVKAEPAPANDLAKSDVSDQDDDTDVDEDSDKESTDKKSKKKTDKNAQTGDESNATLWAMVSIISLMGLVIAARRREN